ncbi:hypothetical protein [Methylobacterium sp. E-046]|uniref:hypothetical protein n=1 Tax=Methylobacterium sp. E-046 TaxID=2836576 RepID=UPI001FB88579|nr:hypothetical protein [Methylobacterium sp. E-046]MCJ2099268.1 hypothetical protein [Methylobacterium sp. E-046]
MIQNLPACDLLVAHRPLSLLRAALQAVPRGGLGAVGCILFLGRGRRLWAPIFTEPLSTGALTGLTFFLGRVCTAALVVGHGAFLTLNQLLDEPGFLGGSDAPNADGSIVMQEVAT